MNLVAKRLVESRCAREDVLDRLVFWADRYGFTRTADAGEAFVFTRGSEWHALYTFDIRKVPTSVEVVMVPGETGSCLCTMTCASWFQVAAPRDEWRLSEQMDLLEACLKGALAAQASEPLPADTERATTQSSHDIKRA